MMVFLSRVWLNDLDKGTISQTITTLRFLRINAMIGQQWMPNKIDSVLLKLAQMWINSGIEIPFALIFLPIFSIWMAIWDYSFTLEFVPWMCSAYLMLAIVGRLIIKNGRSIFSIPIFLFIAILFSIFLYHFSKIFIAHDKMVAFSEAYIKQHPDALESIAKENAPSAGVQYPKIKPPRDSKSHLHDGITFHFKETLNHSYQDLKKFATDDSIRSIASDCSKDSLQSTCMLLLDDARVACFYGYKRKPEFPKVEDWAQLSIPMYYSFTADGELQELWHVSCKNVMKRHYDGADL